MPENTWSVYHELLQEPVSHRFKIKLGDKPVVMHCDPFYLMSTEAPQEAALTGASNLIRHYGLETSYSTFCTRRLREELSCFLPGLPGQVDTNGYEDGSSLMELVERPPVTGKELTPLSTVAMSAFRLHEGPVPLELAQLFNKPQAPPQQQQSLLPQQQQLAQTPAAATTTKSRKRRHEAALDGGSAGGGGGYLESVSGDAVGRSSAAASSAPLAGGANAASGAPSGGGGVGGSAAASAATWKSRSSAERAERKKRKKEKKRKAKERTG